MGIFKSFEEENKVKFSRQTPNWSAMVTLSCFMQTHFVSHFKIVQQKYMKELKQPLGDEERSGLDGHGTVDDEH